MKENKAEEKKINDLLDYLSKEHNLILLESDVAEIELILNPKTYPYSPYAEETQSPVEEKIQEAIKWEMFYDESYFDMWAVCPVGDTDFHSKKLFHLPSEHEALALMSILNQSPSVQKDEGEEVLWEEVIKIAENHIVNVGFELCEIIIGGKAIDIFKQSFTIKRN